MTEHIIQLRYSNDGGWNYSPFRDLDAGPAGDFTRPLIARRLGFCRDRVWDFCDTSPFASDLFAASIDMESE